MLLVIGKEELTIECTGSSNIVILAAHSTVHFEIPWKSFCEAAAGGVVFDNAIAELDEFLVFCGAQHLRGSIQPLTLPNG
ncbi:MULTISPECIES: hypothetical protein [Rhodopirellula]|nr:hypothetical protein [Rhodopirellula sp. UBA1907]|tara:strand:+ start:23654 stop:23893 length:240 start_codon:yes stop_codon:yes gene_type:complete